jgi:hypothetical protein
MNRSRSTTVLPFPLEPAPSVGTFEDRGAASRDLASEFEVIPWQFPKEFSFGIGATSFEDWRHHFAYLEVDIDESGRAVAADRYGAAVAVAGSPVEAVAAWEEAAREHYEDLAVSEGRLHPRLHEQLLFLRKFFG